MTPARSALRLGLVPLFANVFVLGCNGFFKGVKVEGKLLKGPVAFTLPEGQLLHLSFVGTTAQGPR